MLFPFTGVSFWALICVGHCIFTRLASLWTAERTTFVFDSFYNEYLAFLRFLDISSCAFSSYLSFRMWSIRFCLHFLRWLFSSIFSISLFWRSWFSSSSFWLHCALSLAFLIWRSNFWLWSLLLFPWWLYQMLSPSYVSISNLLVKAPSRCLWILQTTQLMNLSSV